MQNLPREERALVCALVLIAVSAVLAAWLIWRAIS